MMMAFNSLPGSAKRCYIQYAQLCGTLCCRLWGRNHTKHHSFNPNDSAEAALQEEVPPTRTGVGLLYIHVTYVLAGRARSHNAPTEGHGGQRFERDLNPAGDAVTASCLGNARHDRSPRRVAGRLFPKSRGRDGASRASVCIFPGHAVKLSVGASLVSFVPLRRLRAARATRARACMFTSTCAAHMFTIDPRARGSWRAREPARTCTSSFQHRGWTAPRTVELRRSGRVKRRFTSVRLESSSSSRTHARTH